MKRSEYETIIMNSAALLYDATKSMEPGDFVVMRIRRLESGAFGCFSARPLLASAMNDLLNTPEPDEED